MSNLKTLHANWSAADRAFTAAIESTYPKEWPGDVRYTSRAKGEDGSPLRAAYDTLQATRAAFYDAGGAEWLQGRGIGRPPLMEGARLGGTTDADIRDRERDNITNTGDC